MYRKITGLFLLLSFLLLKSVALYAHPTPQRANQVLFFSSDMNDEEIPDMNEEETPDATQETKQVEEVTDQDKVPVADLAASFFLLKKKSPVFTFPNITTIYISLSNPPPDLSL